jgi:hypothetical protein
MVDPILIQPNEPDFLRILNKRLEEISTLLNGSAAGVGPGPGNSARLSGTNKQRLSLNAGLYPGGSTFWETDTKSLWVIDTVGGGHVWAAAGGTAGSSVADVAYATGSLTLSNLGPNDIPGTTLTLANTGDYFITGVFDFRGDLAGDSGADLRGYLNAAGTRATKFARFIGPFGAVTLGGTVSQQWIFTASAGDVIKLQADKSAGTGGSSCGVQSSIAALLVS